MKKLLFSLLLVLTITSQGFGENLESIKGGVIIKKNLSLKSIKESMKKQKRKLKKYNIKIVIDPKFNCKSLGFKKKELFSSGVMYGTKRQDGGIDIGGKGAFVAYKYLRYIKKAKECKELSYTKKYNPQTFGEHTVALIFK